MRVGCGEAGVLLFSRAPPCSSKSLCLKPEASLSSAMRFRNFGSSFMNFEASGIHFRRRGVAGCSGNQQRIFSLFAPFASHWQAVVACCVVVRRCASNNFQTLTISATLRKERLIASLYEARPLTWVDWQLPFFLFPFPSFSFNKES